MYYTSGREPPSTAEHRLPVLLEETLPPRTRKQLREYVDPAESDDSDASAAGMILDGLIDGENGEAIE